MLPGFGAMAPRSSIVKVREAGTISGLSSSWAWPVSRVPFPRQSAPRGRSGARPEVLMRACFGRSLRATLEHKERCWRAVLGALSPARPANRTRDCGALGGAMHNGRLVAVRGLETEQH